MRRTSKVAVFVLSALLLFVFSAMAQTKEPPKGPDKKMPPQEDMQKMMEMYAKFSNPGPEHAKLATMAGEWTSTAKMWMSPDQPPMEMSGTRSAEMILGGRFLKFEEHGQMMGKPTVGMGTMGFDIFRKEYTMSWMDDMGTVMLTAAGTADSTGNTITQYGKMDEPVMNIKDQEMKYVTHLINDKSFTFEMYQKMPDGKWMKMMEDTYTKK